MKFNLSQSAYISIISLVFIFEKFRQCKGLDDTEAEIPTLSYDVTQSLEAENPTLSSYDVTQNLEAETNPTETSEVTPDSERESFVNNFMEDVIATHYTSTTGFTYTHSPVHTIHLANLDKKIYTYLEQYATRLRERLELIERLHKILFTSV